MIVNSKPTEVLILGGGFGGLYTALHLQKLLASNRRFAITLVARDNFFLMTPLLFEAGSGVLEPRHAVSPLRGLLDKTRFVEADITEIDLKGRTVHARHPTSDESYELPYDQLVVAVGGVTNRALIPGSEHAYAFKTLADAIYVRNHIIDLFERADVETNEKRRRELLRFVIVGAGLVGIELMGELTEFTHNIRRSYPGVRAEEVEFHIIEGGPNVLPEMDRDLAAYAVRTLEERGVKVHPSSPVKQIEPTRVHLPNEILETRTILLAAGVGPNPLLAKLDVEKGKGGRIVVDANMRVPAHPEVWALGDCALIPDPEGKPYPQLAQHALREARVLAHNIYAVLHQHADLKPFVYQNKGTLASLGHFSGVGRVMKFKIFGFVAWWVWRTYYLLQMPRTERRIRIMLDWTIALFFRNDIVKLDLFGEPHPTVQEHRPEERVEPQSVAAVAKATASV